MKNLQTYEEFLNESQYFIFDTSRTFRYFKVVSKSAWDNQQFAAIAEVGMF